MSNENITRLDGFNQVCVWPGCLVGKDNVEEFVGWMADEFGVRVQYLEEIKTAPDFENGAPVEGTGNRNDLFFAVHDDDIETFAGPRLSCGIRWIEDAISQINGGNKLYPDRVEKYKTWEA